MKSEAKAIGATGSAVGLGSLALAFGLCCVSPWAVTLFGVGGAVLLARLAFVQPYVVAGTFVLLILGFWHAYRRLPAAAIGNRKVLRWIVWVGAVVVIALDIISFVPLFLS
ncbi:MAG: hypothetical protein KGJ79_12490 [Alphaproteobacteria bacterium]|nr:hypothetical protein [Alphaproteobacteria bacterium]